MTRAFNHAVDLFCIKKDEDAQLWADKALALSHLFGDDGELTRLLETRWTGVRLGTRPAD